MFFGCGEKLLKKPDNLIPKEKMINILKELTIINSAKKTSAVVLHEQKIDPTGIVFNKYGIDSLQFVMSDRYYASVPAEYEAMYVEIEKQLEEQQKQIITEKKLKDSLELQKNLKTKVIKKKVIEKTTETPQ